MRNEELHQLYSSANLTGVINWRMIRRAWHVAVKQRVNITTGLKSTGYGNEKNGII
jgi:hypothetical protein